MASKASRSKKSSPSSTSKGVSSPSSSTTSSLRLNPEAPIDGQISPASSSAARSKSQHFYSENMPVDFERSKENVTVTVRFRPLRFGVISFFFNFTLFLANACKFLARFNCSNWMDGSVLGKFGKGKKWRGMQMEKPSSGANTIRPLLMHTVSFLLEAVRLVGFRLIFFFAVIGLPVRNF